METVPCSRRFNVLGVPFMSGIHADIFSVLDALNNTADSEKYDFSISIGNKMIWINAVIKSDVSDLLDRDIERISGFANGYWICTLSGY